MTTCGVSACSAGPAAGALAHEQAGGRERRHGDGVDRGARGGDDLLDDAGQLSGDGADEHGIAGSEWHGFAAQGEMRSHSHRSTAATRAAARTGIRSMLRFMGVGRRTWVCRASRGGAGGL